MHDLISLCYGFLSFPPCTVASGQPCNRCYDFLSIPQGDGLCEICGADGKGVNYTVFTCEGCKSFFKRYARGEI